LALIELDLTAQPDRTPGSRPPARRYRVPGLLLAAVLLLTAGGAAPVVPVLWRYLGEVPAPGVPAAPFALAGGRVYTSSAGAERVTTAWSLTEPPRRLWSARLPSPDSAEPDDYSWGGPEVVPAGAVVVLGTGRDTTVVDAVTGAVRWTAKKPLTPLSDGRTALTLDHVFRAGTRYDQASGAPGQLYFSATGEPHTEPPLRTELHGVDLGSGRTLWTVTAAGSVNVMVVPGAKPAVLLLSSDRLRRIDGATGAVVRNVPLPAVDGDGPSEGELIDGLIMVHYGRDGVVRHEVAYDPETLERRWSHAVPETMLDAAHCGDLLCLGGRHTLDVLDPRTGVARWRAPADVDLIRSGDYVLELGSDSGVSVRLVDPATGATRVDLAGWRGEVVGSAGGPIVLRRSLDAGASAFGVVLPRHDAVQPLGVTGDPISDCTSDEHYVTCRADDGLRIWAYRA